jgi:hypothetical protein
MTKVVFDVNVIDFDPLMQGTFEVAGRELVVPGRSRPFVLTKFRQQNLQKVLARAFGHLE